MTTPTPIKRFYAPGPWITRELRECVQAKDYDALASELAAAQEWREAVLNELIVAHIYTKEHDTNPRKAIQDAITWNCQVALDPAVSSDAQKFIAAAQEARQRAEEQVLSRIIGIATVGNIDGHEVIRRQSAIDVVRMVFAAIDAAREGK